MTEGLKGLIPCTRELGRLRTGHQEPVLDKQGKPKLNDDGSPKLKPVRDTTWRLTSPSEELLQAAANLYGGKVEVWEDAPTQGRQYQLATERNSLEVMIPLSEASLSQAFELWRAGGCERRCDGERMTDDQPCVCPADISERMEAANAIRPTACKPTTRLNVLLPDIPDLGFWRLEAHGYNAAVEIPGTLALFTGLARQYGDGLQIVRAHLRIESRTSKKNGQTRHFTVPVIETPSVTPRTLLTGETPALGSPVGQVERGSAGALEAGEARSRVPAAPTVPPPFTEADEVLAGPEWARKFKKACKDAGLYEGQMEAIVWAATNQRTAAPEGVLKDEIDRVREVFHEVVDPVPEPAS